MHEKLKVNIQKNGVENLNTNNNIKNLEIIKAYKNGELKNIKVNKNEVAIPSKNINFKTSINDKNYNINNNQYKNEKINTHNQNENSNYQLMKENKNNYEYSYSKIHTYHPVPYPHSSIIKNDIDNHHHHHHHHHHHQYRHNHHSNGMKRINEKHKKTIDFIDNLNAQFKFNIEPTTEKAPQKVKANMREDIQSNDKSNDTLENKDLNEKYQNDNIQKQQHHHHYHPYTYQCDYLNYSISDLNTKENRQKNKDIFDLSDIKEILEAQSNKLFKKNISFSIENEELRCPSNKPYHLKQRMENRQRKNNKNYEILANTNELMLEKDLNEREIQFYCLRVMEQKAQQKHSEIIKQRKEKMSNHNQHINNVRRQNILDRSKWRCERSQKMNCRQLKVEQNRRKIINGKKALYASFVDKAKNVVMDLKKRENMLKLKRLEDLNEKMNESEKRRQILMTTSKSKILDVSFSLYQQQQIEKIAALDIQRWWRKKYFGSILNKFIDLDISSDIAKSLSFEKLHEKLHSSEAMEISKDLLYRIFKSSPKKNSIDNKKQENDNSSEKDNNDNLSTKISNTNTKESSNKKTQINIKHYSEEKMFLSAFMIYGHSKTVISSIGDVEKDLIEISEKMIKSFEKLIFSFNQPSFYSELKKFNEIWDKFSRAFEIWKKKDTEALLNILIQHWIEMENLWFSVKDYEQTNIWQSKIVIQQRNIKKKIETLAGRNGILKLIRTTHKARESKFPGIIFKPNVMPSPYLFPLDKNKQTKINPNSVVNPQNIPKEFDGTAHPNNSVSTNTTISESESKDNKNEKENNDNSDNTKEMKEDNNINDKENKTRDIDQTFVMNLLNEYNQHFTNFQLAHEIILNPNFQFQYLNEEEGNNVKDEKASNIDLSEDKYNNIISKVTKIAQKAFFNLVQESFDSGNETQFIPGIIKDIKDRLLYLTNKNKKTYDQINEVLDEKLIIQQIQHGTTDFNNIFKFVLDTMLQLCAPIRDPIIKKIYTMETPVQKIKAILNQLDNMKIDLANYNIKKFRPILKNFAVEYERKKFKEAIKSNLIDLQYTERWLTQSIVRLIKKQSNIKLTKELKKKKKENQTRYIDIYNDAFSSLLFKREIVNNDKTLVELGNTKLPNNNNNSESNNCIDNNKSKYSSNSTNKMSNVGSEDGRCSPSKMNKKNNNSKDDEIILPETLMFDFNRVLEYQKDLRDIAIVSSIIILCQSIVPYLHGKEFIVNNLYSELLDYIENNIPKQKQKQSENKESSDDDRTTFVNNDNKSETNVEEGKKKNKMDKESKLSSIMADFSKYIVTKIETVILDSVINYNNVITNYVKLEPKILSANEKVLLKKMIVNILMLNNNMYNVISRQIMSLFLHYLKTGIFKTETLDRFCLQYSKDRLEKIFIKIKFFTEYNRDVYSEYYDNIISKLLIIYKFYPS